MSDQHCAVAPLVVVPIGYNHNNNSLSIIELGVGIDSYKNRRIWRCKFINGSQVAAYVDTPIPFVLAVKLVIVEERMMYIFLEQLYSRFKSIPLAFFKLTIFFVKSRLRLYDHFFFLVCLSRYSIKSSALSKAGDIFLPVAISFSAFSIIFSRYGVMRYVLEERYSSLVCTNSLR